MPIELLPLRQSPTGLDCGVARHGQDGCAASAPPCFASVCTAWLRGSRSLTQAKILVDCDGVGRASCNRGVCRGRYLAKFPHVTFQMLLDRLSPRGGNGFAVNIGGQNHDPIYPLFERGYAGLAIEAEPRWHDALIRNLAQVNSSQQVFIAMERVSPVTLPSLLWKFRVPSHFDALKNDIDSIDLTILRTVLHSGYSPQIVMIEVNHDIPPPFQFELEYDPQCECKHGRGAYGASVDAVYREASLRGYSLVAMEFFNLDAECAFCEHNLWFVRNEAHVPKTSTEGVGRRARRLEFELVTRTDVLPRCAASQLCGFGMASFLEIAA